MANTRQANVRHALLLTRPYSWVDAGLNVCVGALWFDGEVESSTLPLAFVVGLLLWASLNWTSERIQRDPGRTPVSWPLALTPVAVAATIVVARGGADALPTLLAFVFLSFLYPWKARVPAIGPFGPLIRGLQTASFIATGHVMVASERELWPLLAAFATIQVARSLTGDLRDIETDKYELPKLIGFTAAKAVVLMCLVASLVLFQVAGVFGLVAPFVMAQLLANGLARQRQSYQMHMLFVVTCVGAKLALVAALAELHPAWLVALAVAQLLLLATYIMVPRPSNAAFLQHLGHRG